MQLSKLSQAVALSAAALVLSACNNDSDNESNVVRDVTPPLLTTDDNFTSGHTSVAGVFLVGDAKDDGGVKSVTYQINDGAPTALNIDNNGHFAQTIALNRGENAIKLTATDKVGNQLSLNKAIYLGDTIAAGNSHSGAIKDGKLFGWGRNNFGQTGIGITSKFEEATHPDTPKLVNNAPTDLVSLSFNQNHSLAIDKNGQVYSWGEDKSGQLGRGDTGRDNCTTAKNDCRLTIAAIPNIANAVTMAAGYRHNLVLDSDGNVWAFGAGSNGQLGNGETVNSSSPVQVDFSKAENVGRLIQVAATANSSFALDDKGQVWGWGSDAYANFGRGVPCNKANNCIDVQAIPILLPVSNISAQDEKIIQLATGRDHVLALTNKNSVYGWGLNATSQVGYNGAGFKDTDKSWGSMVTTAKALPWFQEKSVRRLFANGNLSYALLNDGKAYPWGMYGETKNIDGKDKTVYDNLNEPEDRLQNMKNIDNMAMGSLHQIAKETDGSIFSWGWSFEGSLGKKDTLDTWMFNTPIVVDFPAN